MQRQSSHSTASQRTSERLPTREAVRCNTHRSRGVLASSVDIAGAQRQPGPDTMSFALFPWRLQDDARWIPFESSPFPCVSQCPLSGVTLACTPRLTHRREVLPVVKQHVPQVREFAVLGEAQEEIQVLRPLALGAIPPDRGDGLPSHHDRWMDYGTPARGAKKSRVDCVMVFQKQEPRAYRLTFGIDQLRVGT